MISKMTLNEISDKIGISRTTIYKVINKKGTVSDETKQKVLAAIEKYNYVPNYNARDLAKARKYKIAYIGMRHLSAKYFSILVNEGLKRAYDDFVDNGLEILIQESDFNHPYEQLEHIKKMRKKGIENFIISPSDENLLKEAIEELQQQNCNVIFLSRYIDVPRRTYVGVDYYKSGMLAGEMLTKIAPEGGKVAIVTNSSVTTDTTVRGRYTGFVDWIKQHEKFQIVETIENINTDEQALEQFKYLQNRYDNFRGLDAVYDVTYKLNILAQKLSEINMEKRVKLIGFDVYPENIEYINSSAIDIVIGQQLVEQAYDAVKMMFQKMCYGVDYQEKNYHSKLNVIVSSNVDCFI